METENTDKVKKKKKKKTKRGNGEGTIYEYKNGYAAQITVGRNDEGKLIRKTVYGKTREIVKDKLLQLQIQNHQAALVKSSTDTMETAINAFLQKKKLSVSAGTWHKYEINARVHVISYFKDDKINEVTKPDVQKFIGIKAQTLAPATVKILHLILQQVFNDAIDNDLIVKNPADRIELPTIEMRELDPLTEAEMTKILEVCFGTRLYPVVLTEYGTGLRRSEILALKWEDFDFANKTVSIKRSYVRVKSKATIQNKTKSKSSKAVIAVPDFVIDYLQNLERTSEYVFAQKDKKPLNPNNFRRDFKIKVDKLYNSGELSVENLRFHDLRHNYASQLVALNVHQRLIQAQMRHADPRTTSRYQHTTLEGQQGVANTLNTAITAVIPGCSTVAVNDKKNEA
ncbi:site-specific recombinase XerD [Anaerospora hongkongensis]|uniref:Site-specific recombinase XerD n=1 Tax=Anaerospora hongkongensis TaxID=244830 RepID=A0A4R1Q643_9FIRM|nr:site-specific integrase [Anaerospora hongkongensis]TCL40036.1 site-specific recombinase XerD [Anaerospora hongkongensis]